MKLYAVIIANQEAGTNYEVAPDNDFGFSNIGTIGNLSGVYIGDGWVLTAAHVTGTNIILNGSSYSWDGINNETIGSADLRLFRISGDPGLSSLTLASSTASNGTQVYMAGNGRNQESSLKYWNVSQTSLDPVAYDWVETTPGNANAAGYQWASGYHTTWGTNNIDGTDQISDLGYTTEVLSSTFNSNEQNEAIVAVGDSGGGLFYQEEGSWVLGGIHISRTEFVDQASETSVFGNSSYAANLAEYSEEINTIMASVPELSNYSMILAGLAFSVVYISRKRNKH